MRTAIIFVLGLALGVAVTTKSLEALKTIPVGLNCAPAAPVGKLTTSGAAVGWALPFPSYWVETAV